MGTSTTHDLGQTPAAFDASAFRRCLGQFGTGVAVITADYGGSLVGMTANSFSSVSLDPPLVLWSVKRESASFPAFESAEFFAVNLLARDQIQLSKHFGKSGIDKFESVCWTAGAGGAPRLDGAAAVLECRRVGNYDGGDHVILLGNVLGFQQFDREPLLFVRGSYSLAAVHPDARLPLETSEPDAAGGPMNEFTTSLLYRAHGVISEALEVGRREENLTVLQTRVMSAIETMHGDTLEQMLPHLFMGVNTAEVTLDELLEMGLVYKAADGQLSLSAAGAGKSLALLGRARMIEAEVTRGISPEDLRTCRSVLRQIMQGGTSGRVNKDLG